MSFSKVAILAAAASIVSAAPSPLTPATSNVGASCLIQYTPDTTGTWTNATVLLRSGSNLAMTTVATVISGFDATTGGTIYWTCPDVTPNSAIYFYEFNLDGLDPTWTTRFAIASSTGQTTTPTNSTQQGQNIPWGNGHLVSGATVATASVSGSTGAATTSGRSTITTNSTLTSTTTGAVTTSTTSGASGTGTALVTSTSSTSSSSSSKASSAAASASASAHSGSAGRTLARGLLGLVVVAAGMVGFA
ncbi:hypothetical protein T439DRAFT_327501 [Meredithblackwellia eburnea MCA 4105]